MSVSMSSPDEAVQYARSACIACRKSKRRCDRKIPSCDLCIRKRFPCFYAATRSGDATLQAYAPATPTSTASLDGTSQSASQESSLSPFAAGSDAKAIYFIAPQIFQHTRLELPRLDQVPVPGNVSALLGHSSSIRKIATTFYITIHRWLPIVSKRGFFASLLNPLTQRRTEMSLLALCMKLCCTAPTQEERDGTARHSLYQTAKAFHREAEAIGSLSIHVLQAGLLIAFYELGQAIYPAAYLSIGACARYAMAMGIDKLCCGPEPSSEDLQRFNDIEECRRVWWGILIFDRFLNLSNPTRSLSTADPTFESYLPVDDSAWDDCKASYKDAVKISTGFTLKMGSFARLAQATYLLNQALQLISHKPADSNASHQDESAQLRRTLLALVHATDSEATVRQLEYCAQSGLALSVILLLQDHQLQQKECAINQLTSPPFDSLWYETRTALDRLSAAAGSYTALCPVNADASDSVPIFLIQAMSHVAAILLRFGQGTPDAETRVKVDTIWQFLRHIDSRWRLAGVYLKTLEAREIMISAESIKPREDPFATVFERQATRLSQGSPMH